MPQRYRKTKVNGKTRQLSRHLMEQHLGRPLGRLEIVHHVNEDKLDDRIENYELTTPKEHSVHHNQKHPLTKLCKVCGEAFEPHPTKRARAVTCSRVCFRARCSDVSARLMDLGAPAACLTLAEAGSAYDAYAAGHESQAELARKHGVDDGTIHRVLLGQYTAKDGRFARPALDIRAASVRPPPRLGESNARAVLNDEKVSDIRAKRKASVTLVALAREHRVSVTTIKSIIGRRTWAHVQ